MKKLLRKYLRSNIIKDVTRIQTNLKLIICSGNRTKFSTLLFFFLLKLILRQEIFHQIWAKH